MEFTLEQTERATHPLYRLRAKKGSPPLRRVAEATESRGLRVDASDLSKFERGEKLPHLRHLSVLAEVYGVSVGDLARDVAVWWDKFRKVVPAGESPVKVAGERQLHLRYARPERKAARN